MGSSFQQEIGSPNYKRTNASIHHGRDELVVDVDSQWKTKGRSTNVSANPRSFTKIFEAGPSFQRKNEDGCPVSVKVERTMKLREEDFRAKPFNVLSNTRLEEATWRDCFKNQMEHLDK